MSNQLDVEIGRNTTFVFRLAHVKAGSPFDDEDDDVVLLRDVRGVDVEDKVSYEELVAAAIEHNRLVNLSQYRRELAMACGEIEDVPPMPMRCAGLLAHDFANYPIDWNEEEFIYVDTYHELDQLIGLFGSFKIPLYVQTMMRINHPRGF